MGAADIEAVRAAYRPPSRILDTLAHLHHRWTPLLATFALLTFAGATCAIAGRTPQPLTQQVVAPPDPSQYAEAARALRLGNSAVAIQLLQQLTVSAPTFDRGRAHLVSLLLIAGIVAQRTTLLEHIDRLAESPTYGEWAHCLIVQDLVDRPLLSTAELDVTCPRPVSIR